MKNLLPTHLRCTPSACPSVYDPEDGSDELLVVGKTVSMVADEECVPCAEDETVVRISRELLEGALKSESAHRASSRPQD